MRSTYYFFLGTTAEYIKMVPVITAVKKKKLPFKIIASGQNDITKSELHDVSGLSKVDFLLSTKGIASSPVALAIWWIFTFVKGYFKLYSEFNQTKSICIVHGDTVSTLLGASLAKVLGATVVHVEAGLRSYNYASPFPEEITRVLTSFLADIHFCPNQWAVHNIRSRGGKKINTHGNTLIDGIQLALKKKPSPVIKAAANKSKYFLAVIHRQENVLNEKLLAQLLTVIVQASKDKQCIFILHTLTKKYLAQYGLLSLLEREKNIVCMNRIPYFDMVYLMSQAEFIITDGGSNQEEAYYLGKPTLILRKNTERIEGLGRNVVMSDLQIPVMHDFIRHYSRYVFPKIKPKHSPSEIIATKLAAL